MFSFHLSVWCLPVLLLCQALLWCVDWYHNPPFLLHFLTHAIFRFSHQQPVSGLMWLSRPSLTGSCETGQNRDVAPAVSHRPLTAEAQILTQAILCGICGGQSGTGACFPPSVSVLPCRCHYTGAPYSCKYHRRSIILATDSAFIKET
jgi:hypothetical protein